jgi:hypothetical protein
VTLADPSQERALLGAALIVGGLTLAPLGTAWVRRGFGGRNVFFARWGFGAAITDRKSVV